MAITTWAATTGDWDDSKFSRGWDGPNVTPAKVDLTTSSSVPVISTGNFISPSVATAQFATNYAWDNYSSSITWDTTADTWDSPSNTLTVPAVTVDYYFYPSKQDFALSTSVPSLDILRLTYVPSASMTTTLYIPYGVAGHFALIDAASLDLNPDKVTWDNWVGDWDSATEAWDSIIDTRPSVDQTFSFDPTTGEAVMEGQSPDPQHRAPKYIPSVQVI